MFLVYVDLVVSFSLVTHDQSKEMFATQNDRRKIAHGEISAPFHINLNISAASSLTDLNEVDAIVWDELHKLSQREFWKVTQIGTASSRGSPSTTLSDTGMTCLGDSLSSEDSTLHDDAMGAKKHANS